MRNITLIDLTNKVIGNAVLPSEFPGEPPVLLLGRERIFKAGSGNFDQPSPGHYETYEQVESITLAESAVSAPNVEPTAPAAEVG